MLNESPATEPDHRFDDHYQPDYDRFVMWMGPVFFIGIVASIAPLFIIMALEGQSFRSTQMIPIVATMAPTLIGMFVMICAEYRKLRRTTITFDGRVLRIQGPRKRRVINVSQCKDVRFSHFTTTFHTKKDKKIYVLNWLIGAACLLDIVTVRQEGEVAWQAE